MKRKRQSSQKKYDVVKVDVEQHQVPGSKLPQNSLTLKKSQSHTGRMKGAKPVDTNVESSLFLFPHVHLTFVFNIRVHVLVSTFYNLTFISISLSISILDLYLRLYLYSFPPTWILSPVCRLRIHGFCHQIHKILHSVQYSCSVYRRDTLNRE